MRILVTGASGFIGARLCETLKQQGHTVVALSRDAASTQRRVPAPENIYPWNPTAEAPPQAAFAGVDGVVHLAGETVVGRWSEAKKQAIRDSRVVGTRNLVSGLASLQQKPKALIAASAIGYYGDRGDEELTEDSNAANDFLAQTCLGWEQEALRVESLGVRLVRLRIGVVLAKDGGALGAMLTPFKLGGGGPLGSGRQWWSWIHRDDLVGLILHLLQSDYSGVVHGTAPTPVRQKEFARVLGRVLKRPAFMPMPAFALKIIMGGFATELLSSKRVLPGVAQQIGYRFQYPELEGALRQALSR